VRRGEHRTGRVERAGGVVEHVSRRQTEVDHVETLLHHPAGELLGEFLARPAHVACDQHAMGTTEFGETDSECVRGLSIELIGHGPPDVVRLDDLIQS
jgi:hypothetical protein